MVSAKQKKNGIKLGLVLIATILGILILIVSIARASLAEVLKEEKENKLRTEPIEFLVQNKEGILEKRSYKLPQANLLPNDFLYFLKDIRENLWVQFSHNSYNKSKILLLIADKRVSEARLLIKNKNVKIALNTIQKAIDTLKYSRKEIKNFKDDQNKINQLNEQIFQASFAYQKILDCDQGFFSGAERGRCKKIFDDFSNWIKKEAKKENK